MSSRHGHKECVRALVVEDPGAALADRTADGLWDQRMAVDVAYYGSDAIEQVSVTGYDDVALDPDLARACEAPARMRTGAGSGVTKPITD